MEVELKYAVPDEKLAEWIWTDDELGAMCEEGSWSVARYNGYYYDTPECVLTENDIVFRIRHEGNKTVACLKWHGDGEGALHKREELNRTIDGDVPEVADPEIFSENEMGRYIKTLIGDDDLTRLIEVDVLRKSMRVDTGNSIVEISIDMGAVHTRSGDVPISEVELELYQGTEQSLLELGSWLSEKYELVSEEKSKFAKGIEKLRKSDKTEDYN